MWLMVGTVVLVIFSIDVINHHNQEKGGKGLFQLMAVRSYSITEGSQGRKELNQEPGGRNERRSHGEGLLTSLLPMAFSTCCLYHTEPLAYGWHCPQ